MKKHIKTSLLACSALSLTITSGFSQNDAVEHAKSKVDTSGTHFSIHNLEREMNQAMEYADLILQVARNSGENIPKDATAKRIMQDLGLANLKAYAQSSTFKDNRWVNKSYLYTGPNKNGIFSILGNGDREFDLPKFAPASTDLAIQLQSDLSELGPIILKLTDSFGNGEYARKDLNKPIPSMDMTILEFLKKANMTAHVVVDLRDGDGTLPLGPLGMKRPDIAVRVDNMNWIWPLVEKELIQKSKLPFSKSQEGNNSKYTLHENLRKHMQEFLPALYIDNDNNHLWFFSDTSFMKKCLSDGKKLHDSLDFKAAFADLPKKGNGMSYISKDLLNEISNLYQTLAGWGELNKEFQNARPLVDRIIKDITKSDTGYAAVISKDALGIEMSGTLPISTSTVQALLHIIPAAGMTRKADMH